jgi:non-canonical purine NTP pyrophosphatase (RdgB/HAM1 family)
MNMQTISIVTGNPGKVRELEAMAEGKLAFEMKALHLPEIQSLDLEEIVKDKLERAYVELQAPVIVDDVSAGLDDLEGLPGPFIKFFNERLGGEALYILVGRKEARVTITCLAAYYDGESMLIGQGTIHGKVVSPRGKGGFGFDVIVVPDGHSRTMAEMTPEEKSLISHRGHAFRDLLAKIEKLPRG